MTRIVTPQAALAVYAQNVEDFEQGAPILLCVGETVTPIMLVDAAPDASRTGNEQYAEVINRMEPPHPMEQVVFSNEAWVQIDNVPGEAALIYSVSSEGGWRVMAPFVRERVGVVEWADTALMARPEDLSPSEREVFDALAGFMRRSKVTS